MSTPYKPHKQIDQRAGRGAWASSVSAHWLGFAQKFVRNLSNPLVLRMTAPVLGVSLVLLGVGVGAAWYVQRLQKNATDILAINVGSQRAAEELEIGLREIRTQLNQFLLTGKRTYLETVPELRKETDHWLAEAVRLGTTEREYKLMEEVKRGYEHFFDEFDRLSRAGVDPGSREEVADLVNEVLTKEILAPAHQYLDFNEGVMATSTKQSQLMADRMVFGLLLLGTCGPVAGLLAGLGIARGVSRSIIQLSVPVHDAAGKLNEVVGPIVLSGARGIEDLQVGLRTMAAEIDTVVNRLQQSQREVLRAEQLAAVGQLAAGVAHELRNPLMSMKLLAQTAVEVGDRARIEGRDLKVLCDAISRVERSVQTFLDFARPPALERRAFELNQVVEQTIQLVAGRAACQGVRIECAALEGPLYMEADQGQIRQVLLNLLLNALDAMPDGGKVTIEFGAEGSLSAGEDAGVEPVPPDPQRRLSIRVGDTGCGLPVDLGERIFEPFVTSKDTGVGLGLPICKRIVETHGGQITATNRPEGGAVFTVQLPLPALDPQEATPSGNQVEEPLAVVPT